MSLVNMDEMLDDADVGSGSGSDGNFSFDSIDIVDSDILADMDDILHELEDMETVCIFWLEDAPRDCSFTST